MVKYDLYPLIIAALLIGITNAAPFDDDIAGEGRNDVDSVSDWDNDLFLVWDTIMWFMISPLI